MPTTKIKLSSEADEQIVVIEWCSLMAIRYKGIDKIFHIPNGGSRNKIEAARLKAQGVKKGVPDLCLPVPLWGYHGLYIEMKYDRGKTSADQDEWIAFLSAQGYKTAVCYGATEAINEIEKYYKGNGRK